jgi:hypothetical protein
MLPNGEKILHYPISGLIVQTTLVFFVHSVLNLKFIAYLRTLDIDYVRKFNDSQSICPIKHGIRAYYFIN